MPPNSALTRFLKQGLKKGVCPLCCVAYKIDGEYMWAFFDEYSNEETTLNQLRRARGFCAEHAGRLQRLEVEGLRSNLGISNVYLDTFQGLAEQLAALQPSSGIPEREPCPACAYRDEEVHRNARYLLEEVMTSLSSRKRFVESTGLCFPHFELVWDRAEDPGEQELLLDLQSRVVARLVEELSENIRKQGHEYDGKPADQEDSSWRRAIYLTAGWPREALRDEPPAPEDRYILPDFARVRR